MGLKIRITGREKSEKNRVRRSLSVGRVRRQLSTASQRRIKRGEGEKISMGNQVEGEDQKGNRL